jgi:hypothetical protein
VGVNDGVYVLTGIVNGGVYHGLAGWAFDFGYLSFIARPSEILLANFHVFVDIDQDNVFALDLTKWRQHRFDKKFPRSRDASAHMTVIVGQSLVKHDSVSQGYFVLEFF